MAAIATLKAVLGMDNKSFQTGIRDSENRAKKFQGTIASVGKTLGVAFSAAAVIQLGKKFAAWASDISIAARNAGVLTSEMIALNRVAIQSGIGVGDMQRLLAKLQTELFNAATGTETSVEKFEQLGLSVKDLVSLDPASMLQKVAKAAMESNIPLATLTDLFGERLGPNAMVALKDIAENGLPAVDKALGVTADSIEAMGSKWARIGDEAKGVMLTIVDAIDKAHSAVVGFTGDALAKWWENTKTGMEESAKFMLRSASTINQKGIFEGAKAIAGSEEARGSLRSIGSSVLGNMGIGTQSVLQAGFEGAMDELEQRDKKLADATEKREQAQRDVTNQMVEIVKKSEEEARAKRIAELQKPIEAELDRIRKSGVRSIGGTGSGVATDSLARVGGMIGNQRAGVGIQDRQIRIQQESGRTLKRIEELNRKLVEIQEQQTTGII